MCNFWSLATRPSSSDRRMTVVDTILVALAWPAAVVFGLWLLLGFFLYIISH